MDKDKFLLTITYLSLIATIIAFVLKVFHKIATIAPLVCLIIFIGLTILVIVREFRNAYHYNDPFESLDIDNKETPPWNDEEDA